MFQNKITTTSLYNQQWYTNVCGIVDCHRLNVLFIILAPTMLNCIHKILPVCCCFEEISQKFSIFFVFARERCSWNSCRYYSNNAVKFFTLFEAAIDINHDMHCNLPGTTNNYTEFPHIFLDSLLHEVYLHKFKNTP
jgi:hypothetical protein